MGAARRLAGFAADGGNFVIDDSFLVTEGVADLDMYSVTPGAPLLPDFFVSEESLAPEGVVPGRSLGHE